MMQTWLGLCGGLSQELPVWPARHLPAQKCLKKVALTKACVSLSPRIFLLVLYSASECLLSGDAQNLHQVVASHAQSAHAMVKRAWCCIHGMHVHVTMHDAWKTRRYGQTNLRHDMRGSN